MILENSPTNTNPIEKLSCRLFNGILFFTERHYLNPEGKEETVVLSEYVEKSYQGKVIVKMTQKEAKGELEFEV
ncbi:hypothetical protein JSQ81_13145 [Sporosarcina sp. Marseille-Q4063]|uniref:hypothetical protein n=1 Tax=Sporosarcina sp. Marseille-Q4063 TaxID=2810514 RepID=UPI001BAE62A8|nr:hypothetical protein [Sporosarcina sp. Marseille-Q4063]QUW20762.1 hypothetical protein JSQ81_13145 [Sporosarcina sp. Marseille-Q4063]